jgi:UPF0755 protein
VDDDRELRRVARRAQARKRRAVAAGVILLLVLGGGAAAALALHRSAAPAATTIPPLRQFKILFPEGFTRAQMAARVRDVAKIAEGEIHHPVKLDEKAYLAASRPRAVPGFGAKKLQLEGFLFPNTYYFDRKSSSSFLVNEQLTEFRKEWRKVGMSYARSKNLTPYDVLKIASMIQGESGTPGDNKFVAAVIYNRLHQGMTLGIDATLAYGLHLQPGAQLTQSDLASPNPYNTRKYTGLPPTPIDNPGLAAIQAAAHPANVDYLYYLKIPHSKRSYFTASYQDFLNHKAQYGY